MQTTNLEELREKIDAEISELRLRIAALSSERNTLAPISHLPPEVLSRIFLEFRGCSEHKSPSDLLTWICRYWRDIAIDCSALWSIIDFHHQPSLELYFPRSKNVLLEISFSGLSRDDIPPPIPLMLQHIHHTRTLSLVASNRQEEAIQLNGLWDSPAPLLRSLMLRGVNLPINAFNNQIPSLEKLTLIVCDVPWKNILQLSNLTTLSIAEPITCVSLSDFLFILRQSPHLTELVLDEILDMHTTLPDYVSEGPVVLSSLASLKVTYEEARGVGQLLRHLRLPETAKTSMEVACRSAEITEPVEFLRIYYTSLFPSKSIPVLSLRYGKDYVNVEIYRKVTTDHNETHASLHLHYLQGPLPTPNFTEIATTYLNFDALEYLTIKATRPFSEPLELLFGNLPCLRIIEVKGFAADSFLRYFVQEGKDMGGRPGLIGNYLKALAASGSISDPIAPTNESTFLHHTANLRFRALEHLTLILPSILSYNSRAHELPERHDRWLTMNFFSRRIGGIGLKKFTHVNWISEEGYCDIASRVVDEMQMEPKIQADWDRL